jgi:hypothetical protein
MLGFDWNFDEIACNTDSETCEYITIVKGYHNEHQVALEQYSTRHPLADKPDQPFEIGLG